MTEDDLLSVTRLPSPLSRPHLGGTKSTAVQVKIEARDPTKPYIWHMTQEIWSKKVKKIVWLGDGSWNVSSVFLVRVNAVCEENEE